MGGGGLQKWGEGSTGGERYTVLDVRRGGEGGSHFLPSQNLVGFFSFVFYLCMFLFIYGSSTGREMMKLNQGWEKRKDLSSSGGPLGEQQ